MALFGKSKRFPKIEDGSPGPVYLVPTTIAVPEKNTKREEITRRNQNSDGGRVSWMNGIQRNNVLLYKKPSTLAIGPTEYQNMKNSFKDSPQISFTRSKRYLSQKVRQTTHAHARESVAMDSPGPKYRVTEKHQNTIKKKASAFSFGATSTLPPPAVPSTTTKSNKKDKDAPASETIQKFTELPERGRFLTSLLKEGVQFQMTQSKDGHSGPGPCDYESDKSLTHLTATKRSARPVVGNAPRFQSGKEFINYGALRSNLLKYSPGPVYLPKEYDIGTKVNDRSKCTLRAPVKYTPVHSKEDRSKWTHAHLQKAPGCRTINRMILHENGSPGPAFHGNTSSTFETKSFNAFAKSKPIEWGRRKKRKKTEAT